MRRRVDISIEMHRRQDIGDAAIEAFFSGNGAGDELPSSLAAIADELRALANGPVPEPTPQLAALLANGFSAEEGDPATSGNDVPAKRNGRVALVRFLAGLSVAAKAGFGTGVAMASVTAVAAAGALPAPLQNVVATGLEAVTPFDLPNSDEGADDSTEPADFGERVNTDAKDGGVDGKVVSEEAKQNGETNRADPAGDAGRPDDPGSAGVHHGPATPAADRRPTPAADQRPAPVPGTRPEAPVRTGPPATVPVVEDGIADDTVVDSGDAVAVPGARPTAPGGTDDVPAMAPVPVPTDRGRIRD